MLKALVRGIEMRLPPLSLNPNLGVDNWNNNLDMIYDSLSGIDMKELFAKNIEFTNNTNPLNPQELQNIENKWLFFQKSNFKRSKIGNYGPYFLAFKPYNLQPKERGKKHTKIYYVSMRHYPQSIDGVLDPSIGEHIWQNLTIQSFTDDYVFLTNNYNIYLAKSNTQYQFINWNQDPFTKQ